MEPIHTNHLVKTHLINISFSFVANFQKIHFTLRLNPGEFGRSTDIHVYLFWNICLRTDESSCHETERSIKLVHMLSHTSKMAPASLPLCLPMKSKAAHQTADKNLDKKGIFYSQLSTEREEKCDIRDRRNLLLFRLWTLNSLSALMRKQDQRSRWHLNCVISISISRNLTSPPKPSFTLASSVYSESCWVQNWSEHFLCILKC